MKSRISQAQAGRRAGGFSLLELIVVITVMAILLGVAAPITKNMLTSSRLNEAINLVTEEFEVARMRAKIEGKEVEVRLYQYDDGSGADYSWRGFQTIVYEVVTDPGDPGYRSPGEEFRPNERALTGVFRLPDGVVFHDEPADLSTLLTDVSRTPITGSEPPVVVDPPTEDATAVGFRFLPDGSTDLDPAGLWHATLVERVKIPSAGGLPANYATLQIDPLNGELRWLRP